MNPISFTAIQVVKTDDPTILRTLDDSFSCQPDLNLEKAHIPYYEHLSFSPDKDGFYRGILLTGEEKQATVRLNKMASNIEFITDIIKIKADLLDVLKNNSKEVLLTSFEDLKALPILKGVKFKLH